MSLVLDLHEQGFVPGMNNDDMMENLTEYGNRLAQEKWKKYCTEGDNLIEDPHKRRTCAIMLETMERYLKSPKSLIETTDTSTVASFQNFAFPLIRTVFPNLITSGLVSVQPMLQPVGLVFYLNYKAGSSKGATTSGTNLFGSPSDGSGSNTATIDADYSSERITGEALGGTTSGTDTTIDGSLNWLPARPGTVTLTDGTNTFTDNGSGGFSHSAITDASSTINYTTGAIVITYGTAPGANTNITATYQYNSDATDAAHIPQIDLELASATVTAQPRSLRARWSMRAANHYRTQHGVEADAELLTVIGEEIRTEIDLEILNQLWTSAGSDAVTWSSSAGAGVSEVDHWRSLKRSVLQSSNNIFKATQRGMGNWIVADVDSVTYIESHPEFKPAASPPSYGIVPAGRLANMWDVYKNPFWPTGRGLVGHLGDSMVSTGYIYAPYLGMNVTPVITLDDLVSRQAMSTEYGKHMVNAKYYSRFTIS